MLIKQRELNRREDQPGLWIHRIGVGEDFELQNYRDWLPHETGISCQMEECTRGGQLGNGRLNLEMEAEDCEV